MLCSDSCLLSCMLHIPLLGSSFPGLISVKPSSPPSQYRHYPSSVQSKPRCEDHFFDWYFDGKSGFPENFPIHLLFHQCPLCCAGRSCVAFYSNSQTLGEPRKPCGRIWWRHNIQHRIRESCWHFTHIISPTLAIWCRCELKLKG